MAIRQPLGSKIQCERAVLFVIRNRNANYRKAAVMFGVTVQQIRGRILHRHGSLAAARNDHMTNARQKIAAKRATHWTRPCMVCGDNKERPVHQYRCDECKRRGNNNHDGSV